MRCECPFHPGAWFIANFKSILIPGIWKVTGEVYRSKDGEHRVILRNEFGVLREYNCEKIEVL